MPPPPFDQRGWWAEDVSAQLLFFDPDDLAAEARGDLEPWQPQPYAVVSIDGVLLDPGYDHARHKRALLGAIAFDRERGRLYVVERRAGDDRSVIHVFGLG